MSGPVTPASIDRWLDARVPRAPASLRLRVGDALRREAGEGELATGALRAGESLLARLLDGDCGSRDVAPDLLTADALVTYAFEADAEGGADPAAIDARAAAAMRRIARLAAG